MNYNPYAAPQAVPPPRPDPASRGGPAQPWELGELLGKAWEGFKANWPVLVFSLLITVLLGLLPIFAALVIFLGPLDDATGMTQRMTSPTFQWGARGMGLFLVIQQSFFRVGLIRIQLGVARGGTPGLAELFGGGERFLPMLGLNLLLYIPYQLATIALLVPAFFLYVATWSAEYYVVDAELGPIASLGACWQSMRGQWLTVSLFMLVGLLLYMGGFLGCCVGWLATYSIFEVGKAILFLRASGRGQAPPMVPPTAILQGYPPAGYGQGGGYGGPPPGYGGPPPGYGGPPPGYGGPPPGYGGPPGGFPPR